MVTVAVDGNGADLGPAEVAAGAELAAAKGIRVLLYADPAAVGDAAAHARLARAGVELIAAPVSIAKAENPAAAVKGNPDASIVQACKAVAAGDADALVSGGSTGSALAAAALNIKRDRGIYRPALALPMPRPTDKPCVFLDVGANVECRPEHLVQFAHMGSAFAEAVLGIRSPGVALLSNGEESSKGTEDVREVYERLSGPAGAGLRFIGNVEGNHVLDHNVDVVVTDGFTGNITLKVMEGVSSVVMGAIKDAASNSLVSAAGGMLLYPEIRKLRRKIDPELQGGAYMLGLRKLGVVAHGRFSRVGFASAIEAAARGVEEDVIARTRTALQAAGALRRAPAGGEENGGTGTGGPNGGPGTNDDGAETSAPTGTVIGS